MTKEYKGLEFQKPYAEHTLRELENGNSKPWLGVAVKNKDCKYWLPLCKPPEYNPDSKYCFKPKTCRIGDVEFERPKKKCKHAR